jgi:hypothetical protein
MPLVIDNDPAGHALIDLIIAASEHLDAADDATA